ncbi:hypothetical protein GGR58DRAFT_480535 [Xylaria digitata]|nr:hypothetical protein GGR58DRAFT_480535 [Xylaria digitata]
MATHFKQSMCPRLFLSIIGPGPLPRPYNRQRQYAFLRAYKKFPTRLYASGMLSSPSTDSLLTGITQLIPQEIKIDHRNETNNLRAVRNKRATSTWPASSGTFTAQSQSHEVIKWDPSKRSVFTGPKNTKGIPPFREPLGRTSLRVRYSWAVTCLRLEIHPVVVAARATAIQLPRVATPMTVFGLLTPVAYISVIRGQATKGTSTPGYLLRGL